MSQRTIRVAVTGFGSVGQSLAGILLDEPDLPLKITFVADRSGYVLDPDGVDPSDLLAAKKNGSVACAPGGQGGSFDQAALQASDADFLLEMASTNYADGEPGWTYVRWALEEKMNVVLASKGPLVAHWDELFRLARQRKRSVGFSATHGSPLPAVDMVRFGLAGSRLIRIRALFNSTTGLLLEQMELGKSLDEAVATVSEAGVAETNPRLDIEGWDAAAKCVIVGRAVFGADLALNDVQRQGIEGLTSREVVDAHAAGTPIKLLCTLDPVDGRLHAAVRPARLEDGDPLATLRSGALGIWYDTEPMGPVFVSAYGAGGRPTAAAVIRDVLNISLGLAP